MSVYSLRSVFCFVLLWLICYVPALAQISDGLYKTLPDSLKPKNKTALTVLEKQRILYGASDFYSDVYAKEYKTMAVFLDKIARQTQDTKLKVDCKNSLGSYYLLLDDSKKAITYYKEAIQDIGTSKNYNHTLAWCYSNLGSLYVATSTTSDDSAIACLHSSLQVEGAAKDSALLSQNYAIYSVIYSHLGLHRKAIYYSDLTIKMALASTKWNTAYTNAIIGNAIYYGFIFTDTKEKKYADSSRILLRQVMTIKKKEAAHWYELCYFYLGTLAYKEGDYLLGKTLLDSASLPQYNQSAYQFPNYYYGVKFYKGLCLIKLDRYVEGKKLLATLNVTILVNRKLMYEVLYEHAQKIGDWKTALMYHKQYKTVSDSLDIEGQKGKMFEAEQKYSVAQKELTIAKLESQNLVKETEKRNLLAGGLLGILALGTLGYAANRRQQTKVQKERALLTDNLHRIEEEMNLQRVQEEEEIAKAMATQRKDISRNMHDEVSSSLITLQYYVTDLKNRETDVRMKAILNDIEQEARQAYMQARTFMHDLHNSANRSQYNVLNFLYHLANGFGNGSSLTIHTDVDEQAVARYFTPLHHNELYAVIKEAVANCLKHSGANRLDISLHYANGSFAFSIADNGRGGVGLGGSSPRQRGMGIESLTKRIEALGGTIQYDSKSTGTTLSGSFPVGEVVAG